MRVSLIVAADEADTIGRDGGLPWHLSEDLRRFRQLTTGHVVVAGRRTHESIVERLGHPLPDRTTILITRQTDRAVEPGVRSVSDVEAALDLARALEPDEAFVIGGAEVYRATLPAVERIYLTRVRGEHEGDRFLPAGWLDGFALVSAEPRDGFTFELYERR